jgi:hypothetical protein
MKKLFIALSAVAMIVLGSCSKDSLFVDGPLVSETRTMSRDFFGIECMVHAKVNYKIDPVHKVEIIAQRNILDVMETYVGSTGHVEVKFKNNVNVRAHDEITINISGPLFYHLSISGSGEIVTEGNMSSSNIYLGVNGSGNIKVKNAVVGRIDAFINGSGNISVESGSTDIEYLCLSCSGNINLSDIPGKEAEVTSAGSGVLKVNVTDKLKVNITGSGAVLYRGNPQITSTVSGSGTIRPI